MSLSLIGVHGLSPIIEWLEEVWRACKETQINTHIYCICEWICCCLLFFICKCVALQRINLFLYFVCQSSTTLFSVLKPSIIYLYCYEHEWLVLIDLIAKLKSRRRVCLVNKIHLLNYTTLMKDVMFFSCGGEVGMCLSIVMTESKWSPHVWQSSAWLRDGFSGVSPLNVNWAWSSGLNSNQRYCFVVGCGEQT